MLTHHRPGYLMLPADVARAAAIAPAQRLLVEPAPADENQLAGFCEHASRLLRAADAFPCWRTSAQRYGLQKTLREWVAKTPVAHATMLMGKGLFDEQQSGFVGTYSGLPARRRPGRRLKTPTPSSALARASPTPSPQDLPNIWRGKRLLRSSPSPSGWAITGSAGCRWIRLWPR